MERNKELKNQECYDKNGNFLGWFSRSVAVVVFILKKNKNKWKLLTEIRGKGAADFNGKRCCVCGYCEFNDTLEETCVYETFQEVGLKINKNKLIMLGINSSPLENLQNISVHYLYIMDDNEIIDFNSRYGGETDETEKIEWVNIDELPSDFCFNHDILAQKYVHRIRKNTFFNRLKGIFRRNCYIYY